MTVHFVRRLGFEPGVHRIAERGSDRIAKERRLRSKLILVSCFAVGVLFHSASAWGADGLLEINASCAVDTGCFAGDAPGYPVEITSTSGGTSFRLTSDLIVPSGTSPAAIDVAAADVSIDLNGFRIISASCLSAPGVDCNDSTVSGRGISAINIDGLSVKNGSIIGMFSDGIRAGDRLHASRLKLRWNGGLGTVSGSGSTIDLVSTIENGNAGVSVGPGSRISRSMAIRNFQQGMLVGTESTASHNLVSGSFFVGLDAGGTRTSSLRSNIVKQSGLNFPVLTASPGIRGIAGGVIEGNIIIDNDGDGIMGRELVISHNVIGGNTRQGADCDDSILDGNVARGNLVNGLRASDSRVANNVIRDSGADALALTRGGYAGNTLTLSSGSQVSGTGVNLGANTCDGNACP